MYLHLTGVVLVRRSVAAKASPNETNTTRDIHIGMRPRHEGAEHNVYFMSFSHSKTSFGANCLEIIKAKFALRAAALANYQTIPTKAQEASHWRSCPDAPELLEGSAMLTELQVIAERGRSAR